MITILNGRQLRNDLTACEPARHDHDVARTFTRRAVGDAQIAVSRIPRLREHWGSVSRGAGRVPLSCDLPEQKGAGPGARTYAPRVRDIETIDSELRLVAALRRAARERGGPLPSITTLN